MMHIFSTFRMSRVRIVVYLAMVLTMVLPVYSWASEGGTDTSHTSDFANVLLMLAVILFAAKISSLIERFGQPSVLGELIMGVILGNVVLLGLSWFEGIATNPIIGFIAELGVVILLFQVGLESNIDKMRQVGTRALLVATIGVVVPFVLGTYLVGPLLLPGLSFNAYLFVGATLTATSVGITARVFKDLGKLQMREAQIVLGAAVIDDVMGLIILAVVSAMVTAGAISIGVISWITAKAILFLIGSIVIGQLMAPIVGKALSKIHAGVGMKLTLALMFLFVFAYVAGFIGLAPIVGAFAAGLVLDPVHFKHFSKPQIVNDMQDALPELDLESRRRIDHSIEHHTHRHVEDLIEPIAHLTVPVFFIVTGMSVRLETLFNFPILMTALGITVVAFVGKIVAGFAGGPHVSKWLIGWGMVPRGEVGLIFATIGKSLGVIDDAVFSVIVIMVIFSTLFTPPVLTFLLKRTKESDSVLKGSVGVNT